MGIDNVKYGACGGVKTLNCRLEKARAHAIRLQILQQKGLKTFAG